MTRLENADILINNNQMLIVGFHRRLPPSSHLSSNVNQCPPRPLPSSRDVGQPSKSVDGSRGSEE